MPFIMILIEKSKTGQLISCKVGEKIAFILLEEFLNSLGYVEKDAILRSFEITDLVGEISRRMRI